MDWLAAHRQADGGWMIPIQERWSESRELFAEPTFPFDLTKPSSHIATGMVLRAFAVHPDHRRRKAARDAANLLKERLFQPDPHYTSMGSTEQWTKFKYPFWWPNALTLLDALSRMGYREMDRDVRLGLDWFIENQGQDSLWRTGYSEKGNQERLARQKAWIALAICRIFKQFSRAS